MLSFVRDVKIITSKKTYEYPVNKGERMDKRQTFVKWIKRIIFFVLVPLLVLSIILALTIGGTVYYTVNFFKDTSAYLHRLSLPNSIDVLEPVEIGGIKQWVSIRGYNKDAPILLFLHGGPGYNMIRIEPVIASQWEEYFTVVFWDQRGCGKSYYTTEEIGKTMTVEQLLDDTSEMIAYLRKRFNREKIFVLGHSWGSYLGISMAKLHPDWLYAYIGAGQVVNSLESKQETFNQLLTLLEEKGDQVGIEKLNGMVPFPDQDMSIDIYYKHWGKLQRMLTPFGLNEFHQKNNSDMIQLFLLATLLSSHTTSLSEMYRDIFSKDQPSKLPSLMEGVRKIDVPKQIGYKFDVPVFIICGKYDWQVYYQMSINYFQKIKAPYKEMMLMENSAHVMMVDEPGRFFNFLVDKVLPYADR